MKQHIFIVATVAVLMLGMGCGGTPADKALVSSPLPPSNMTKDLKSFFVSTLPPATAGSFYSQPIALIEQENAKNYTLTADSLPVGLTVNGLFLKGAPEADGQYQINFFLEDGEGNQAAEEYTFSIYKDLTIISDSLVPATAGKPYKKADGNPFKIEVAGGEPPYQFSVIEGALPEGLELSPVEGTISGSPTKTGQYSFTVNVTDALGANSARSFTFLTNDAFFIATSPVLEPATVRSKYKKPFHGEGGSTPYIWNASGNLPAGLNLTKWGVLRGRPETAGNYKFTVHVTDQIGSAASHEYEMNVQRDTRPVVDIGWGFDTSLSDASVGFGGESAADVAGRSISGVGDVNGDGFDDFLIGAHGNDNDESGRSNTGKVYLVLGKPRDSSDPNAWPRIDSIVNDADASFIGEATGNAAGYIVAGAGDVNGDGFDDFLIRSGADQVYLILGKAEWTALDYPTGDLRTPLSHASASFRAEPSFFVAGRNQGNEVSAIVGAGDVNGDGFDDFLIGVRTYNYTGPSYQQYPADPNCTGQIYLMLGKASGWTMGTSLDTAKAKFYGEEAWDYAGGALAGVGDINKDGYDDFLIGAGGYSERPGKAYLFLGRHSANWGIRNLSTSEASFIGKGPHNYVSSALAGAGDVNGDGFDDFLIGASANFDGGTNAGQAYLILGRERASADWWVPKANLGSDKVVAASFTGEAAGDYAGAALAGVGDINADGLDDFLVGSPGNHSGAGKAYLILGKTSGWTPGTKLSDANVSFTGEATGNYSGSSLAGIGDVDGNGYTDLLIGAYGNSERANGAGKAYIILAPDSNTSQ